MFEEILLKNTEVDLSKSKHLIDFFSMNGEIKNCQMIFRLALGLSIFCHDD